MLSCHVVYVYDDAECVSCACSVLYVSESGGGTLIPNQYSPNGNGYEPEEPREGKMRVHDTWHAAIDDMRRCMLVQYWMCASVAQVNGRSPHPTNFFCFVGIYCTVWSLATVPRRTVSHSLSISGMRVHRIASHHVHVC